MTKVVRSSPGESVTSRALTLLDAFDQRHRALTLSQVSRRSGLPLATAQRRLGDLVAGRLLTQRADGRFEIGARMWHLGQLSHPTMMREAALPHVQDLVSFTGHTAHVAVLDGLGALVVDRIAGSRSIPTRHSPGGRLPLYCTAVGKALLAFAPEEAQEQALRAMVPHTDFTITNPQVMKNQLAEVRRTHVAMSSQENRVGVFSIAVPIFVSGHVIAAVGLLIPIETHLAGTGESLQACAINVGSAIEEHERRLDE
jgi:DNA-binding IclR family transcriptional regulator